MENLGCASKNQANEGLKQMTEQMDANLQCSYCRGFTPAGESECLRCGAPLPTGIPAQEGALTEPGDPQEQALEEMIEKSHQDLLKAAPVQQNWHLESAAHWE